MTKRPNSGQWDISRSHQLELPGEFFKREIWLVCVFCPLPFTFSGTGRLLEVRQPLCHYEATSMRMKARQPKRRGERKAQRSSGLMMWWRYVPAPDCLSLDWTKRDPYLIKQLWLEFSVTYSCTYCWFRYQVPVDVSMNNEKKKTIMSFQWHISIFCGSTFTPTLNEH